MNPVRKDVLGKRFRARPKIHEVVINENLQGFKDPVLTKGDKLFFIEVAELANFALERSIAFRDMHRSVALKHKDRIQGLTYFIDHKALRESPCCISPSSDTYRRHVLFENTSLIPDLEYLDLIAPYEHIPDNLTLSIEVNPKNLKIFYYYSFYSPKTECWYNTLPIGVDRCKGIKSPND